jgi:hypothetical protein
VKNLPYKEIRDMAWRTYTQINQGISRNIGGGRDVAKGGRTNEDPFPSNVSAKRPPSEQPCEGVEIAKMLNVDLPNELSKVKIALPLTEIVRSLYKGRSFKNFWFWR